MLKCLLNLKIFSSRNFKFENLAEQSQTTHSSCKGLSLFYSYKDKETVKAMSKDISI